MRVTVRCARGAPRAGRSRGWRALDWERGVQAARPMVWPSLSRVPLHVTSRVFDGHDRLMATIDTELEKATASCAVSSCDVTLTGDRRGGYRATVALELQGGRWVSQCSWGHDVAAAIVQAFAVCRLRGAAPSGE